MWRRYACNSGKVLRYIQEPVPFSSVFQKFFMGIKGILTFPEVLSAFVIILTRQQIVYYMEIRNYITVTRNFFFSMKLHVFPQKSFQKILSAKRSYDYSDPLVLLHKFCVIDKRSMTTFSTVQSCI
jgi:hypothetical protein